MIINLFIQDNKYKLNYKEIEKYTHISLLIVSLITAINSYFDYDYSFNVSLVKYYLFCEIFFIPFYRKDLILHHIISISVCKYIEYYNINLITNFYSTKQILLTEISSIFLSISSLIKLSNMPNIFGIKQVIQQICMIFFVITFTKYRLYDYYNNIITNSYFYSSLITNDSNIQFILKYSLTYSLFALNLYWFVLIIKKICKHCFNYSMLNVEYTLQYSYFGCLLSTCSTYALVATSFQKEYYSSYISLDVASNFLLSLTSYEFHKHIYNNLLVDENMNRATIDYKNYLLQDIIIIQGRGLVQLYCHFHMHNIFETYKYFFYFQIFYSVFLCFNVDALYYNMIVNKTKFPINEINLTSKYLDFLLGSNAFICVLLSSLGVYGTNDALNNIICSYIIALITFIKPFNNINHLMIHIIMIFQNYCLVVNNLKITS